ncbi:hypothetical protein [Dictyobacter kobayashii]|uniref:hypothetical protein n=1 Tax=Dictyobacter kobayashii TaxID=2014872 RepID=UPI000F81D5CD|nr:hypothetical protein [Dictyobacter kobayashii]
MAKAEAARRLAHIQRGVFWLGTERTLTRQRHYNLVFLHARRRPFPAFAEIAVALQEIWPWGEVASVEEIESRLVSRWPANLVEATIWKVVGDSLAAGHLLVNLEMHTLDRKVPLALLPPGAPFLAPDALPETLLPEAEVLPQSIELQTSPSISGSTFDASVLSDTQQERFHRNVRAVEQVLAGVQQTKVATETGIPRSTLGRMVRRTRELGQIACVPRGTYVRKTTMHPAFQECIHRLFLLPTRLTMVAIAEHTEMHQVTARLSSQTGTDVQLPSYKQVRTEIARLKKDPDLVAVREQAKSLPRPRSSPESFVLSLPSPALLAQVDDAHDLSLQHLMFLKEVTDQGRLQYNHRIGLCLVAAGRGTTIPLKEILDQPETMWLQFRRRMDKLEPFCRIAGHTSEEVYEVLATVEIAYRELFPQLNLRQWSGIIYAWLTHSLLDPTNSGRVTMDNLMKLVTAALERTYEAGKVDVQEEALEQAAELLMLRRNTFRIIDGAGPSVNDQDTVSESPAETKPVDAKKESQTLSPEPEHVSQKRLESQKHPATQSKCAFCGVVPIDLQQFLDSGVSLVECPDCTSTSSLTPHKETSNSNRTSAAKHARLQQSRDGLDAK